MYWPEDRIVSAPIRELLQEFAGTIVDELAMFIEELVGMADLRLLHHRHVQEH
jgi:hypothetical protein